MLVALLCLLGAVCALYGVAVMMLGSGTWFFAVWFAIAAVLFGAAGAVHAQVWETLPVILRRVLQIAFGACVALVAVTQACAISGFNAQGEDDLDYIIVLGAQVRETGPSVILKYRLDAASDYLQANPETMCIVSGGQGPNEPVPEARIMAEYLEGRGIESSRIIQEDQSSTTYQNIHNSMQLFDAETARVGVVTNNFHVFRSVHIARKQGITHACGIASGSNVRYLPNNLLRESFGITKDFLKGNLGML